MRRLHPAKGFTLVELMVGLAIAAILALVTAPSFSSLFNRMRVQGVANELAADLQYARSESVRRRAAVSLAADADGGGYKLSSGAETVKAVRFSGGLTVAASGTVSFSQMRATANPTTLTLSASGVSLQVATNVMGRVSMCSPDGAIKGYTAC